MKFCISEISNDDISGMGRPIDFVFDFSVGFLGPADQMTYFRLYQIQEAAARHPSNDHISEMGYPIFVN